MNDNRKAPPEQPTEQRRTEFAPHENPRKQGDGDPGPRSAPEKPVDRGSAETPDSVQDQPAQD
jgi:hypothetical protein